MKWILYRKRKMLSNKQMRRDQLPRDFTGKPIVLVQGKPYKTRVILADANIPYKLSLDRNTNSLFFCINADEFSDQSFHSVILDVDNGTTAVIPGIRNGFASAVDNDTSTVYLGGSEGIFKFIYGTNDVEKPAIVTGTDIFDMYFHEHLYFVDTATQNLYVVRDNQKSIISEVEGCLIHHFIFDRHDGLFFINSSGFYELPKGAKYPIMLDVPTELNFRGITTDARGQPHIIAQNAIYLLTASRQLVKVLSVENGYGLAFDKANNIIYSNERNVTLMTPVVVV